MQSLTFSINEEIRSRVTYSALLPRLSPEAVEAFILDQLDRAGLGHNTFTCYALIAVRICTPMVFAPYFSLFSIFNTTFFFASIRTLPIGVPFSTQSALYSDRFNDTILVGTAKG